MGILLFLSVLSLFSILVARRDYKSGRTRKPTTYNTSTNYDEYMKNRFKRLMRRRGL